MSNTTYLISPLKIEYDPCPMGRETTPECPQSCPWNIPGERCVVTREVLSYDPGTDTYCFCLDGPCLDLYEALDPFAHFDRWAGFDQELLLTWLVGHKERDRN